VNNSGIFLFLYYLFNDAILFYNLVSTVWIALIKEWHILRKEQSSLFDSEPADSNFTWRNLKNDANFNKGRWTQGRDLKQRPVEKQDYQVRF
jgi:hypothetical protein